MMNLRLGIFLGCLSVTSVGHTDMGLMAIGEEANPPARMLQGTSSPYAEIQGMFAVAQLPTESEVMGLRSGRCFSQGEPSTARANLLAGIQKRIEGNGGPLFPPKTEFKIVSVVNSGSGPADYFDQMSPSVRQQLTTFLDGDLRSIGEGRVESGSLVSTNESGNLAFRVRKSGDYLLMLSTIMKDTSDQKVGDVYAACYYFKLVP